MARTDGVFVGDTSKLPAPWRFVGDASTADRVADVIMVQYEMQGIQYAFDFRHMAESN